MIDARLLFLQMRRVWAGSNQSPTRPLYGRALTKSDGQFTFAPAMFPIYPVFLNCF